VQHPQKPQVSVVIPNFNGMQHLPECLECLFAQTLGDFEVIMVDNASTDGSVAWVEEHYPEVRIIRRPVNGGPIKSANDGFRAATGKYVVILDNDTAFEQDWLATLVQALEEHPDYDLGIARMLPYEDNNHLLSAGVVYSIRRLCHIDRGSGFPPDSLPHPQRILAAGGNGAICRRQVFEEVGLYDEDYYAMFEDIDFSLRCLMRSKRCLYIPDTYIRHKVGLCRQVVLSYEAEMAWTRNAAIMAARILPLPLLILGLLCLGWREFRLTFPVRPRYYRSLPQCLRRSFGRARARTEGLRMGWAKRKATWETRTVSRIEIYRWLLKGEGPVR
jgi:GT2 family glycosyltransferase